MIAYFVGSATGWIAVILMVFEIVLPYLIRRVSLSQPPTLSQTPASTYLGRMWPHYWLGYALVALALVHAFAVMEGPVGRANAEGIWAATGALLLLFLQVSLGLYLQSRRATSRRLVKRCHFWGRLAAVGFLVLHIGLNGP
jgi:hypothetical protein